MKVGDIYLYSHPFDGDIKLKVLRLTVAPDSGAKTFLGEEIDHPLKKTKVVLRNHPNLKKLKI